MLTTADKVIKRSKNGLFNSRFFVFFSCLDRKIVDRNVINFTFSHNLKPANKMLIFFILLKKIVVKIQCSII